MHAALTNTSKPDKKLKNPQCSVNRIMEQGWGSGATVPRSPACDVRYDVMALHRSPWYYSMTKGRNKKGGRGDA